MPAGCGGSARLVADEVNESSANTRSLPIKKVTRTSPRFERVMWMMRSRASTRLELI
jgi:hypothetical protein